MYEGTKLNTIDPYQFLPDPEVPIQNIQDSEFLGWISSSNRLNLLEEEQDGGTGLFNIGYLEELEGTSKFYKDAEDSSGRDDRISNGISTSSDEFGRGVMRDNVHVIHMYINLVPKEWGIGSSDKPEKWLFEVAGDQLVINAQKIDFNHNKFPVVVLAPDMNGHTASPISRLEVTQPLSDLMNFLFNTRIDNVLRSLHTRLLVDPSGVFMKDVRDPLPGGLIRSKKRMWGKGVDGLIQELIVRDSTQSHVSDSLIINDHIQRATGATDNLQGTPMRAGERVSAFVH